LLRFRRLVFLVVAKLVVYSLPSLAQLVFERWSVKTGTDAIGRNGSTVTAPMEYHDSEMRTSYTRSHPRQTSLFRPPKRTLRVFKRHSDSFQAGERFDYHLVIQDSSGNPMINRDVRRPPVGSGSPSKRQFPTRAFRFDARLRRPLASRPRTLPCRVLTRYREIVDSPPRNMTGASPPNPNRVHPVLNVIFKPEHHTDFSLAASPSATLSVTQGKWVPHTIFKPA